MSHQCKKWREAKTCVPIAIHIISLDDGTAIFHDLIKTCADYLDSTKLPFLKNSHNFSELKSEGMIDII